jgi:uncharacterized SAM-binding protein YcdF (DUF218 family)
MPSRNGRRLNRRSAASRIRLGKRRLAFTLLSGIGLCCASWLFVTSMVLRSAAAQPVDAFLVLGGSITREIYAAELATQHPEIPILISAGSPTPCIWLIFQRAKAPIQQVWLENCARSTFGNFYFSLPILQRWQVHKVKIITSPTHTPRAIWLARILLGAHGIWAEPDLVVEQGVPANREYWWKTTLDVTRSLGWAAISQLYQPQCSHLQPLAAIASRQPQANSRCERQGKVELRSDG